MKAVLLSYLFIGVSAQSEPIAPRPYTVPVWGQCGGKGYTGNQLCAPSTICKVQNEWYSQCVPDPNTVPDYGQCGGQGYSGPTKCMPTSYCRNLNNWYSQCVPGTAPTTSTPTPTPSTPKPTPTCIRGACPAGYVSYICGSDGKTYINTCYMSYYQCLDPTLKILHTGECTTKPPPPPSTTPCLMRPCAKLYEPLCDSNGLTHDNSCSFLNFQCNHPTVTIAHNGNCTTVPVTSTSTPTPTPSITGTSTPTPTPSITGTSTPTPTPSCLPRPCAPIEQPVCASNGQTYFNECVFLYYQCLQPSLSIVLYGQRCDGTTVGPPTPSPTQSAPCVLATCKDDINPVCGMDGVTYKNRCYALLTSCDRQESRGFTVTDGPCPI